MTVDTRKVPLKETSCVPHAKWTSLANAQEYRRNPLNRMIPLHSCIPFEGQLDATSVYGRAGNADLLGISLIPDAFVAYLDLHLLSERAWGKGAPVS